MVHCVPEARSSSIVPPSCSVRRHTSCMPRELVWRKSVSAGNPTPVSQTTRTICPSEVARRAMLIFSASVARKGVFQAIREQFIDQQATRNGVSHGYPDGINLQAQGDAVPWGGIGLENLSAEPVQVLGSRNAGNVPSLTQAFVQECHRLDALLAILEECTHLGIFHHISL